MCWSGRLAGVMGSIDIALVTPLCPELAQIVRGLFPGAAAGLDDNFMKCRIDIAGHAGGVTADIEMRSVLKPRPDLRGVFQEAVLHVNFFWLIPRERQVQPAQHAGLLPGRQLVLVEEIRGAMLVA